MPSGLLSSACRWPPSQQRSKWLDGITVDMSLSKFWELVTLYTEIRALFAQALSKKEEEILPSYNFFLDLGGTSLDYFALLSALKDRFGMEFPVNAGTLLRAWVQSLVRERRSHK